MRGKKAQQGHCVSYTQNPASGEVHLLGSVLAQLGAGESLKDGLRSEHVRYRKIAGRGRRNILFLVDTSGSMISSGRLGLVKGCVVSLLSDAYVTRTRVAVIGFGGARATLALPFTSSAEMAARRIDDMKGGGSTPLLDALRLATPLIDGVGDESAEVVILSDGGCNRPRKGSVRESVTAFANFCKKRNVPIHLVDAGSGTTTAKQRAQLMASMLHADYRELDEMRADMFGASHAGGEEDERSVMRASEGGGNE